MTYCNAVLVANDHKHNPLVRLCDRKPHLLGYHRSKYAHWGKLIDVSLIDLKCRKSKRRNELK